MCGMQLPRQARLCTVPSLYKALTKNKIQMRRAAWSPWLWAGSVCAGQAQSFSFWQKRRMLIDSQQSRTQCAAPARAEGPTALCQEVRPWGEGDACSYPHGFHSTHHNKPHSRALEEPEMCCLHRWTFVVILISSLSSLLITGGPLPAKQPPIKRLVVHISVLCLQQSKSFHHLEPEHFISSWVRWW